MTFLWILIALAVVLGSMILFFAFCNMHTNAKLSDRYLLMSILLFFLVGSLFYLYRPELLGATPRPFSLCSFYN